MRNVSDHARILRSTAASLFLAMLGCGTAGGVCGCHPEDCRETVTCTPAPGAPGPACVADPALGEVEEGCGVFLSVSLGDDTHPGTKAEPVRTFERAIALARSGPMRIYACAEEFTEAVVLPSGVDVWGGLDCAREWIYVGDSRPTVIVTEPDRVPLQVKAGEGGSIVADVRLEAVDATLPGGSSIAMMVLEDAAVDVRRSQLIAGNGADGAPGQRGGEEPAKGGAPGNDGSAACSADNVAGADPVTTVCGDQTTVGGRGGDGNIADGGKGNNGQPEPDDNEQGFGLGGTGEGAADCLAGQNGAAGDDGEHGPGAHWPGRITGKGWEGKAGRDGGDGKRGQGGGGGGGSRGGSLYCGLGPSTPKGGASGGSGGGGGCGGRGGKGGGYGGASIGLLTLSGDVTLSATFITTGNGGDGGGGGLAQLGGAEGTAGIGGASVGGSHSGCYGGQGGRGGNGGYGGGGLGGPSIGIAHFAGHLIGGEGVSITTGEPGKGGPGGNDAVPGSAGEDGVSASTLDFPQ
ncbi:MAG: hypothetical protein IT372_09475 [Polyangiaceae bacterium]|nr:hypothetical protein [Polyangiaceae bacterium]